MSLSVGERAYIWLCPDKRRINNLGSKGLTLEHSIYECYEI